MSKKRIGFYGGSFDPVHFGHLNLAIELMEAHQLDEVLFCPARVSPHKLATLPTATEHRIKMLELAIEDIFQFRVITNESVRNGPSYTVDTLQQLIDNGLEGSEPYQLFLMLGSDALSNLLRWHQVERIVAMVPILIGNRSEKMDLAHLVAYSEIYQAILKGITPTRRIEISSTEIRDRIRNGLYCGHLLPAKVIDYIYQNRLYYTAGR